MKKNILIVDDSALMRRVLSDIIESDDRFQVFDLAKNGLDALSIMFSKAKEVDAILLDINMPRMNGIEFLSVLKQQNIKATIIIVSTIAKKDEKETILALELGAFDFVTKPESYNDVKSNLFSDKILKALAVATKVETRAEIKAEMKKGPKPAKEKADTKATPELLAVKKDKLMPVREPARRIKSEQKTQEMKKLVAIACSTGGPKALHSVVPNLPQNLDASVLIVQHMPGGFTKSLADRLNDLSPMHVKEAEDNEILEKGTVYIAKGGNHMELIKQEDGSYRLSVYKGIPRHGLLPCADIMYESLVKSDFEQITCVVLTGMGGDGTEGIRQLNSKKKIYVIAQNEESSIVYGMPKVIKDAGLVHEEVTLKDVSDAIIKNVGVR
ncbi:chemotaxis-specific protein-glutamate methyltransferase CheB [Mobilitalea sibirica]|uniref:Protein-glutamate methylesterase/protein-glutamine glutaminase n=1 Tax=Mobilitalea sibirica TaxID=1462919 RepID=A0A8J7H0M3_9FIRM|nr:chemotaxis-specific protein-glutamate methyltransferase CheB [Mobilitalea sibirica]MBH1942009.1 chemotaxis-specific protein-glutamate methyltransferase CheB [Mobilitalea sibirica]